MTTETPGTLSDLLAGTIQTSGRSNRPPPGDSWLRGLGTGGVTEAAGQGGEEDVDDLLWAPGSFGSARRVWVSSSRRLRRMTWPPSGSVIGPRRTGSRVEHEPPAWSSTRTAPPAGATAIATTAGDRRSRT
ncbi:hypothetical protein OG884_23225 [Streptosporangium sp. NBC_01755]|uniref:hypothetical protein n=1 Tax=unclassified Streptosporangium TaxID=2632669 RepID=UPI002DDB367C|nr:MULTISPECIES: hypothetical protein [unclassified Streptosporangium]WSA24129.1 hypothetical protein OIE13_24695 [Streptosporangium sp. NBC_01810]WSC97797.1 hypothetical protein OG884_23225 [Streptosporangium sp. NBC_01755]